MFDVFQKVVDCKINISKLVVFLYANNKVTAEEIKKILMDQPIISLKGGS